MPPQQRTDAITELLSSSPAILTDRARRGRWFWGVSAFPRPFFPRARRGQVVREEPQNLRLSDDREHRASAPDQEHRQHPCFAGDDDPDGRGPDHTPDKTEHHIANEPVAVRS